MTLVILEIDRECAITEGVSRESLVVLKDLWICRSTLD